MNDYKQSQFVTLVLNCTTDNTTTFNRHINISFSDVKGFFVRQITSTTDYQIISIDQKTGEMKVPAGEDTTISYPINNSGVLFYNIYTDLINNYIGTVLSGTLVTPHVFYQLKNIQNVNDSFMFRLDDTTTPSTNVNNTIIIQLEFVK